MRKRGFTLPEILLSLAILGILASILLPVIRKTLPDNNKVMFKKSYSVLEAAVSNLINDDEAYPPGYLDPATGLPAGFSNTYTRLTNITQGSRTITLPNTVVPNNQDKFCYLLAEEMNLQPVTGASSSSGESCSSSNGYFRTSDGVDWFIYDHGFPIKNPPDDTLYATRIVIDVNGKNDVDKPLWSWGAFSQKNNNCGIGKEISGSETINSCNAISGNPTPDRYEIGVRFDGKIKLIDPNNLGASDILGNPTSNFKNQ